MVMHRLENIERQEEEESDSGEKKLEHHLVIEFGLKKNIGEDCWAIAIVVRLCRQI